MKSWVKLYTEINRDPDMGTLSWAHRGIWQALLALCGEIDHRDDDELETGRLDTIDRVIWRIRCELPELQDAIEEFEKRGMVEIDGDGILWLTNYPKRQARAASAKPSAVADRVKRHREKESAECNEDVTSLQRGVTPSDTDTDTDTDTDAEKIQMQSKKNSAGKTPAHPPGDPDSLEKPTSKGKTPAPEAIKVFRENANRYPAKSWYADVATIVGKDPPELERWGAIVKEWVGNGWNPTNVRGMLDKFQGKTKDGTVQENGRTVITVS